MKQITYLFSLFTVCNVQKPGKARRREHRSRQAEGASGTRETSSVTSVNAVRQGLWTLPRFLLNSYQITIVSVATLGLVASSCSNEPAQYQIEASVPAKDLDAGVATVNEIKWEPVTQVKVDDEKIETSQTYQPKVGPPPPPPAVIRHQAVFAVRNLSCAMCHAKIESNVISDFSMGLSERSEAQSLASMFHIAREGAKIDISGDFFVPKTQVAVVSTDVSNGESTCANNLYFDDNAQFVKLDLLSTLKKCVDSVVNWGASSQKFVEASKVSIDPPSNPAQIKSIADAATLASEGFAKVKNAVLSDLAKSGEPVTSFKLSGNVQCEGAVVFDAPLVLHDVTVTTQTGCRLYNTRSIFVFGNLKVEGPESSANIQLLSGRAVTLDISPDHVNARVRHPASIRQVFSIGTASEVADAFAADAALVGASSYSASVGAINYERIAVSAPLVHSRNAGHFSGVIVGEQFVGKIGALAFKFDPIFAQTGNSPVFFFPEIKSELTTIEK